MSKHLVSSARGATRLLMVVLLAAAAGCADNPITAPELARDAGAWTLPPVTAGNLVVDPLDPSTETHDFNELPSHCVFGDTLPNPYEGLQFVDTPYFGACLSPNGTMAVLPANPGTLGTITEVRFDLPSAAVSASVDIYDINTVSDLTLNAYDGSGTLVASATTTTNEAWVTLTVTGDIHRLGISSDQGNTYIDNLSITYGAADGGPGEEGGADDPADAAACKKGGWSDFGFKNQGQCVRFVETGKDSR